MKPYTISAPDTITPDELRSALALLGCTLIGEKKPVKRAVKSSAVIEHTPMMVSKPDGTTREIDPVTVGKLCAKVPMFKGGKRDSIDRYRKFPLPDATIGAITQNDDGEWSSLSSTSDYVRRYCELNYLTGGA